MDRSGNDFVANDSHEGGIRNYFGEKTCHKGVTCAITQVFLVPKSRQCEVKAFFALEAVL